MQQVYSPNMLKTFELCRKKFYFKYVKNITMPVNDEIFELGKNIHAIASYYLKKENIDKLEKSLLPAEKKLWEDLKKTCYFIYETIAAEYNLSIKLGDYIFGGRLDALVKNNEIYYVLDYKTGSAPKNATYDYQTIIYLLAVSEFYKTNDVEFIYLDLKNKSEVKIKLTNELKTEYKNKLIEIASMINNEDYSTKQKDCKCEYKIICY